MTGLPAKLASLAVGALGGVLAAAIFRRSWRLVTGEDDTPKATDADRRWPEILLAAAAQGLISALVRAVLERLAAGTARELGGAWPGDEDPRAAAKGGT
jgi:hypothetical protein